MLKFLSPGLARLFDRVPPATLSSTVFLLVVGAALGFGLPLGLPSPYDLMLHGVFFALLTISLSGFFRGRAMPACIVAIVLAAGGEYVQGVLGYRDMSLLDLIASVIGGLSAAGVLSIRISVSMPDENLGFIERELAARKVRIND
ncbi:hypothetical protein [Breoghania sp.]|uniref:hypothetical protein n=1 Tax=Breoghania sp. TaxID=2065378 RepID=UPI002AA83532|nr:hypothetical protein [Breoghania sp.]